MTVRTFTTGTLGWGTVAPANAVQTVTLTGSPTGGTFTLTMSGHTTTNIAYNATANTVETAIAALTGVGVGNVIVAAPASGTYWVVTFQNALATTPIATMSINVSGLTGGTPVGAVTATVVGVAAHLPATGFAAGLAYVVSTVTPPTPQVMTGWPMALLGMKGYAPNSGQLWPRGNSNNLSWPLGN